jgi:hypothetical protein
MAKQLTSNCDKTNFTKFSANKNKKNVLLSTGYDNKAINEVITTLPVKWQFNALPTPTSECLLSLL